ncbi:TPA: restriction endonuclease subunit S [Escherichia albertii]|uniref:Restriction endonuclease subunit S n=1 Tax=Escherichia albertii TaxID=208962 RepID=A0ABD7E885_ESCAL|nr:restriction endonuclease subunit S [Escherichia albertii]MCQ8985452.1 restriction endonuclease subunit S [Escherichia albertii]MCQ9016865.1 restriction endonuclease subunit S [Escherichia albertii]MCZ7517378.1 restriction endonuclease subunit S [Escherichia albertii]QST73062.1 restriction endonuclease subunit S [Escherichia albertii]UUL41095.1 restriction endonuclease subunit S [Escherichia albertii]
MNELSYLEKLLDGVEVEWKTLGSIAELKRGTSITKKDVIDGTIPVVAGGRTPAYYHNTSNRDGQTIVIAGSGAYAGFVSWWEEPIFVSDAFTVKPHNILLPRYCYHFLMNMQQQLHDFKSGGGVPHVYPRDVSPILIPIPCPDTPEKSLAIQSEIVRILDKFTALTAELNMRKKQYNYYRDQLLSFKEGEIEWKTLADVTKKWYSGGTPTAGKIEYYENGNIPWLRTQEVKFSEIDSTEIKITQAALKNSSAKWIPRNCVIIAISGATAGRSAINKIPLTTNQHCGCLEIDDTKALYRYVFHWVSFNYENIKSLGQGARGDLNSTIIKNFKLPIPHASDPQKSLKEQARIVEILDKFDTLTNSITEGLPREIELRQKQYEYYRDLLFNFPKPETVSN